MKLFTRSFLIIELDVAAFAQAQVQNVCPNIVLSRCNQNVEFDWSHTPAGSLNPASCAVGQGGNNSVGSTCASVGTTVTAPVAAGVYAFGALTTANDPVSSNTCTVSYAPGINCANQCQDGFDNDGDGQVDAADTLF